VSFCKIIFTIYAVLPFLIKGIAQQPLPLIGQWKEHLPYKSAMDVAAGNGKIICATSYSFFSVDLAENSVERMSRMTGLNETGVSGICYDDRNDKLLIAYKNSNIDIIYCNDIINVPTLKEKI
jgi:hypothetical protein